jgi:hypothetical protein
LAVKIPGAARFTRTKSLGDDYTGQALRDRCIGGKNFGKAPVQSETEAKRKSAEYVAAGQTSKAPNMLIDIQEKIREGKGAGYEQWAKIFNLKAAAQQTA